MLLHSTKGLHYPVTVTRLYVGAGDAVEQGGKLFQYSYKFKVQESDKYGDKTDVERDFFDDFLSSVDGKVGKWNIRKGDVLSRDGISLLDIEEPCKHENQFGGLCADCGKDMTEVTFATVVRLTDRAPVTLSHAHTELKVSRSTATKISSESQRRLLSSRKLSLVVDLDQTIIHATVDPTVAEWQKDKDNPNYPAVKDVRAFQLVDEGPGGRGCWYYIKLRPNLLQFLETVSQMYELHIYTMGTRAYAQHIAKIVDPDRKIFGDRILSRDENGSLSTKSLQRLFPYDTKMVVIIDDRADVWHWSDNLIKVVQYDFFVGIGDINSSFLPKVDAVPKEAKPVHEKLEHEDAETENVSDDMESGSKADGESKSEGTTVDDALTEIGQQMMEMANADDPAVLQEQNTQQEQTIAAQVEDKPLLKRQQLLDKLDEDEAAKQTNGDSMSSSSSSDESEHHHAHRHNLLRDDDTELMRLEENLRQIHANFYRDYDRNLYEINGSRVAQLKGQISQKRKRSEEDREEELNAAVPDIKYIMPAMKREVLAGVSIVFSGVVPINVDPELSDFGLWAKSFGATIERDISRRTTHVVATRDRKTAKVKMAAKKPRIHLVAVEWLIDTFSRWQKPREDFYRIVVEPEENGGHGTQLDKDVLSPFDEDEDRPELSGSETEAENFDTDATNTDTEAEGLRINVPTRVDIGNGGNRSPVEEQTWEDIDAELAEFMQGVSSDSEGDDDDDEDFEDPGDDEERDSDEEEYSKKRKRRNTSTSNDTTLPSDSETSSAGGSAAIKGHGSRLQKRRKKAFERVSSLTNVATVADSDGGLPSPVTGEGEKGGGIDDDEDGGSEYLEDEFEKEMEKEMEQEEEAEETGGDS